ncbi:MAG: hypothetical protein AVO34_01905 [Firmicutes bacterium ML8_F2]|jgi:UPF0755 protein|nr:MAG: hypothetical protein AVO34_01905 [Firmicutes bacterium ML8_F2]
MKLKYLEVVFLSSIVIASGLFFIYAYSQINTPLSGDLTEKNFIIQKGEGLKEISHNLEEAGLINQAFWFKFYVLTKGWAARLQAGEYSFSPSMNIPAISQKILRGEIVSSETTVTIPEGFSLRQIDARLAKAGLIEENELLNFNILNSELNSKFQALHQENGQAISSLEGYLFPDTYRFYTGMSKEGIIEKMLDNFDKKLTNELREEISRQGKTLEQIIIMASLIEKEVRTDEDRRIVSGIFWRRINNNYPLQSCATIAYILGIDKWRYSAEDTKINSLYNTYQNIGLPIGPINNPGISAIQAAIYPHLTDYNFFLSTLDGETIFSRTLEEHNQNRSKYLD